MSRIACVPQAKKRTASMLGKAATACVAHMQSAPPATKVPRLYLGKYAHVRSLESRIVTLRSGATSKVPANKLAKLLPQCTEQGRYMTADSPAYVFWGKPAVQVPFLAGLDRFAAMVHGEPALAKPPVPIIWPTETALQALRSMGPEIGWDVETLGADPLTDLITCIGVSDGEKTVSLPWDSYSTSTQGWVDGIATAKAGLLGDLRTELLACLESRRVQVTQNGSYDVLAMASRGLPGRNDFDIMHAYAVLWPECPKTLEDIALHMIPRMASRWKVIFRGGRDGDGDEKGSDVYADSAQEDLRDYNGDDCWHTIEAKAPLEAHLATED